MQKLTLLTTLALFILILGCAREEPELNTHLADAQLAIKKAQDRVAEVEQQLALEETEVAFRGNTVVLPAGSTDGDLEAAIDQAGNNGTVIVASGDHYESGTVVIDKRVRIQGEEGAVLYVDVSGPGFQQDPALHVKNVNNVRITGLELRPQGATGNTGILVEDGARTRIQNNRIIGFGFAVWLYGADNGRVLDNYVEGVGFLWGIVSQKGLQVVIRGNEVTNCGLGIFVSDKAGTAYQNVTYGNAGAGMILCTAQFNVLPDGTPAPVPDPSNDWVITQNNSFDNGIIGYQLIDGAFENLVVQNAAANNGLYDIWLRGEFTDGIFFPTSRENQVISVGPYNDLIIKDCGVNNTIIGGNLVDTTVDPCPE